jgi:hypothetical protein
MDILAEVESIINPAESGIHIDTIRATFLKKAIIQKFHTKMKLLDLIARKYGKKWLKLDKQAAKAIKIERRYEFRDYEIVNIYMLSDLPIFYATLKNAGNEPQKALFEVYGLRQYNKTPPPKELIAELLGVINNVSSLDLCFDKDSPFNLDPFCDEVISFENTKYLKNNDVLARVYFYDKAKKNNLNLSIYRAEAVVSINPKSKDNPLPLKQRLNLQLPYALDEFKSILDKTTKEQGTIKPNKSKDNKRELRA